MSDNKVVNLADWKARKKEEKASERVDADYNFAEVIRKTTEAVARLKKEREEHNKKTTREYNLKRGE